MAEFDITVIRHNALQLRDVNNVTLLVPLPGKFRLRSSPSAIKD
jgi:hypothetical protein